MLPERLINAWGFTEGGTATVKAVSVHLRNGELVLPKRNTKVWAKPAYQWNGLENQLPASVKKGVAYAWQDDYLVVSQDNPRVNGKFVSGGNFFVRHESRDYLVHEIDWVLNGVRYVCTPFSGYPIAGAPAIITGPNAAILANTENSALSQQGATGWRRAAPGNPVAGLGQFVIELRDIPRIPFRLAHSLRSVPLREMPRLMLRRLASFRELGSEYLNQVFGWLPFLRDLRDMVKLYWSLDRRLAQIYRDNGKGIRRRRILKDSTETTILSHTAGNTPFHGWSNPPPNWVGGNGFRTVSAIVTEKVWFVGKYRYYIPDVGSSQWTRRATRALFGANVTPGVLWDVLPWSWLIGWFSNVGDAIHNATGSGAVDNLTADYAYMMRTIKYAERHDIAAQWAPFQSNPGGSVRYIGDVLAIEFKQRVYGSPYGFGVTYDGLSTYQKSIIAALGLSRSKF